MPWIILLISAVFEAIWATALSLSDGLSNPGPSMVFFVALAISMAGLGWAVRTIPIGTGYAVWTGVGAALTVIYAMITGAEPVSAIRILLIGGIIASVVGLKLVRDPEHGAARRVAAHASSETDAARATDDGAGPN